MCDVSVFKYTNGFSVYTIDYNLRNVLKKFAGELTQLGMNTNQQSRYSKFRAIDNPNEKKDEYFYYSVFEERYYFSIELYDLLMELIRKQIPPRGIGKYTIDIVEIAPCDGKDVVFDRHTLLMEEPESSYFFYQNDIVNTIANIESYHDVLEVQTGRGKTKMAFKGLIRRGKRVLMTTKPCFTDKWVGDVEENLHLTKDELVVCRSLSQFIKLLTICEMDDDDDIKFIIVPNTILESYFNKYNESDMVCAPVDILRTLKVGSVLYDESHMFFLKNYISHIMLNARYVLDLSATIDPGDRNLFLRDRYFERFPREVRYNKLEYHKYAEAYSIYYGFKDKKVVKRINSMKSYNHTQVEDIIMQKGERENNYYEMIFAILNTWYLSKYKPGRKAIIFFSTKDMCTRFKKFLERKKLPDGVKVTRSIEGDDYKEFIKGDIYVSTPGKSGTAVDLPGLMLSIITPAIQAKQQNLQMVGRPRDNRDPNDRPKTVYLHCNRIRKHVEYLRYRQSIIADKVVKFVIMNSRFVV